MKPSASSVCCLHNYDKDGKYKVGFKSESKMLVKRKRAEIQVGVIDKEALLNKRTFINDIINYLLNLRGIKIKFAKMKRKKYLSSIGNNSLARKELNWKLKKNILIAAKELIKININDF